VVMSSISTNLRTCSRGGEETSLRRGRKTGPPSLKKGSQVLWRTEKRQSRAQTRRLKAIIWGPMESARSAVSRKVTASDI